MYGAQYQCRRCVWCTVGACVHTGGGGGFTQRRPRAATGRTWCRTQEKKKNRQYYSDSLCGKINREKTALTIFDFLLPGNIYFHAPTRSQPYSSFKSYCGFFRIFQLVSYHLIVSYSSSTITCRNSNQHTYRTDDDTRSTTRREREAGESAASLIFQRVKVWSWPEEDGGCKRATRDAVPRKRRRKKKECRIIFDIMSASLLDHTTLHMFSNIRRKEFTYDPYIVPSPLSLSLKTPSLPPTPIVNRHEQCTVTILRQANILRLIKKLWKFYFSGRRVLPIITSPAGKCVKSNGGVKPCSGEKRHTAFWNYASPPP